GDASDPANYPGVRPQLTWTEFGLNLPQARVTSVRYVPKQEIYTGANRRTVGDTLVVATLGRGAFRVNNVSQHLVPPPFLAVEGNDNNNVCVLPVDAANPTLLDVIVDNQVVEPRPIDTINSVRVRGFAGDDDLHIDSRLAVPQGISFDGGAGNNRVIVLDI